jgi:hypothetical protein
MEVITVLVEIILSHAVVEICVMLDLPVTLV